MKTMDIRFVLVEPSHPGNIGGAARAMKNMGLDELVLHAIDGLGNEFDSVKVPRG